MPARLRALAAPLTAAMVLAACLGATFLNSGARAGSGWSDLLAKAEGQEVFWNAWGGDERINAYIAWVGERVAADHGITLRHVKLSDTAEAVARVLAEKAAGKDQGGSIDLIWINGENFAAMKENGLLHGPITDLLPNFALVDVAGKPTTLVDFTVPTEGFEAPWGAAKINFIYDSARQGAPPRSMREFLDWAREHQGRFTYPAPPDFIGSTMLKQVVIETTPDPGLLQSPVPDDAAFEAATAALWDYLDALHPHLWRQGRNFPTSGAAQRQLLDDGEVDITISFYPSEASSLIAQGLLPETARVFVLDGGTIGNVHFVAIPYNARSKEGAMVIANFLMSPEAQARKQDINHWGDETVLAVGKLAPEERKLFDVLPLGVASLTPEELGPTLLEPHPSWMTRIEAEWLKRYSR
jgi:putative thiamine transport system substrate-binding protein